MQARLGVGETVCLLAGRDGWGGGGSSVVSLLLLVGGNIVYFRFVNDRPRAVPAGLRSPTG